MIKFKRGTVFWVHLDILSGKTRPCIIISNDDTNKTEDGVTVLPLSTSIDGRNCKEWHLRFKLEGRTCQCLPEFIYTVAKSDVFDYISTLEEEEMIKTEDVIRRHLDLFEDKYNTSVTTIANNSLVASSTDLIAYESDIPILNRIDLIEIKKHYTPTESRFIYNVFKDIGRNQNLLQTLADKMAEGDIKSLKKKVYYLKNRDNLS